MNDQRHIRKLDSIPIEEPLDLIPFDHFDKVEFMDRTMGNGQLSLEMVTLFIDNGPVYIENIRKALAGKDPATLYRSAHKLKGAAETMALPRLAETAHLIELAADSDDLERAAFFFSELLIRFGQATEVLREEDFTIYIDPACNCNLPEKA